MVKTTRSTLKMTSAVLHETPPRKWAVSVLYAFITVTLFAVLLIDVYKAFQTDNPYLIKTSPAFLNQNLKIKLYIERQ